MSTAKLSKTFIRFVKPNNLPDRLSEGYADHANLAAPNDEAMLPGTLVVRNATNGSLLRAHDELNGPVEIVWTDGTNRSDAQRLEIDGTSVTRYTTVLPTGVTADVAAGLFITTPVSGDVFVVKGDEGIDAQHGKYLPVTNAELASLATTLSVDAASLVVGKLVQLNSRTWEGVTYHRVSFV